MAKLNVDVRGVERTFERFERDLHQGMESSATRLGRVGKRAARDVLQMHDRIFNREVYQSFKVIETKSNKQTVRAKLVNYADHAGAVEYGVPASEYVDGGPPVQALLPWVERKMSSWTLDYDSDGSGGSYPVTFKAYDSTLVTGDIPGGWRQHGINNPPDRTGMFIGQSISVGNRNDHTVRRAEVTGMEGDYIDIEYDDGSTTQLRYDTGNGDEVILGAEDWYSRTREQKLSDIRTHIENSETDHPDGDEQQFTDVLMDRFYPQFRDIDMAKRVGSSFKKYLVQPEDDNGAFARSFSSDTYALSLKTSNSESTIIHENTHGFHLSLGYSRQTYASWPGSSSNYKYPDFWFSSDGTSYTDEKNLHYHLLRQDSEQNIPGLDKMGEVWELAQGNFDITYETGYSSPDLLHPSNPQVDVGDVIKIQNSDGDTFQIEILDDEPEEAEWNDIVAHVYQVKHLNGGISEHFVNPDGTSFNDGTTVIGYAENPEFDYLPISDYGDDDVRELIEGVNLAWMKSVFSLSQYREDGNDRPENTVKSVPDIWRKYSTRNPNETLTTLTEVMLTEFTGDNPYYPSTGDIVKIDRNFPGLIEAWLDVFEPSEEVKVELDELGIDY